MITRQFFHLSILVNQGGRQGGALKEKLKSRIHKKTFNQIQCQHALPFQAPMRCIGNDHCVCLIYHNLGTQLGKKKEEKIIADRVNHNQCSWLLTCICNESRDPLLTAREQKKR